MMECFKVHADEIEGRIDPLYLKNKFILEDLQPQFKLVRLGSLLKCKVQYGANESAIDGNPKEDVRYIRITDIDEFGNLKNDDWKTSQNIEKKYELNESDILFARSGATAGKCFFYKNEYDKSIFAGYLIRFVFNEERVNPKYVFYYSQLKHYKLWVISIQRPSGQPNINSEEFKSFKIPLPPIEVQNRIVNIMNEAYKTKKQKETKAKKLLDSINDYVLDRLGIKLPELKDRMTYIIHAHDLKGKRLDAYYYQPKFKDIEGVIDRGKYKYGKLNNILEKLISGQRPKGGVSQIKNGIPSLGGEHVSEDGSIDMENIKYIPEEFHKNHLKSSLNKNDLLVVKDGATTGKIGIIPEDYRFNEVNINEHLFLLRCKDAINPYFLFSFLKSRVGQIQFNREITGGTIMGIVREAVEKINISLPSIPIQNKIAEEVKQRMLRAKQLQEEARKVLEETKEKAERIILGEEET